MNTHLDSRVQWGIGRRGPRGFFTLLWLASRLAAAPAVVNVSSTRDTSIYSDGAVDHSNGGGAAFIVGANNNSEIRRGLLRFDLSNIPLNAVIEAVSLRLTLAMAPIDDIGRSISLHRALASWGENPLSDAGSGAGSGFGVPAASGDATWLMRFFEQGPAWATAGGDFAATASAATIVSTERVDFRWSGPGLLQDVQAWVASPASNFGWFVLGDESDRRTTRQFFTRESTSPNTGPMLTVTFSLPKPAFTEVRVIGDTLTLVWNSVPGTHYQLQTCDDLASGSWGDLGAPVQATAIITEWSGTGVMSRLARFYRLKLL